MKKYQIQVINKSGDIIKTIKRTLWSECIGNFNPLFCRYLTKRHLVKSKEGDLSDPFRREASYLENLFITID
jgi:hypothetical protein